MGRRIAPGSGCILAVAALAAVPEQVAFRALSAIIHVRACPAIGFRICRLAACSCHAPRAGFAE